jgi:hypothetical protein
MPHDDSMGLGWMSNSVSLLSRASGDDLQCVFVYRETRENDGCGVVDVAVVATAVM